MIAILSTAAYDPAAPLVLRLSDGSSLDDMPVRVSRQQTLDGGAEADWRGQFASDRKMTLKAELTRAENDTLSRWLRQHDRFTLSCESGFFVGVIENVSGLGGTRTIRFLALESGTEFSATPPEPVPPPPEGGTYDFAVQAGADDGIWYLGDGTPSGSDIYTAGNVLDLGGAAVDFDIMAAFFVRFEFAAIPSGATITAATIRLTAQGGESYEIWADVKFVSGAGIPAPNTHGDVYGWSYTSAVNWATGDTPWAAGDVIDSPDVSAPLNEIVGASGYTPGPLVAVFQGVAPTFAFDFRSFRSYDNDPASAAILRVTYDI